VQSLQREMNLLRKYFPALFYDMHFQIAQQAVAVLIVHGISLTISFILNYFLAHEMGASGYGIFIYGFSWVTIAALISGFGIDVLAVREIAVFAAEKKFGDIKGFIRWSSIMIFIFSILIIFLIAASTSFFHFPASLDLRKSIWFALPAIIISAFINLSLSSVRAMGDVVRSQIPDRIVRPFLFLIAAFFILKFSGNYFSPYSLIVVNVIALFFALILSVFWLRKLLRPHRQIHKAVAEGRKWIRLAFPILLINGFTIFNIQFIIIILGSFTDTTKVGAFGIAIRLSELVSVPLNVANLVLAPRIAQFYSERRTTELQKIIRLIVRLTAIVTIPIVGIFMIFPSYSLHLFGDSFVQARSPLLILLIVQIINVITGPDGYMLIMSGYQHIYRNIMLAGATINVIAAIICIHFWNDAGAAAAILISTLFIHAVTIFYCIKKTTVNTTLLTWKK
jgi:O-antigen/teichoic acid export membrane protein